jgi:tetratricopeptide (TPR) repeat protein
VKRCFVIQGYGQKTDYSNGRVLDLDASYAVIKEAVEDAGLECIRCDEIAHSGVIDVPMYQQLLEADLVIADLSTYNINAAFELGVRYALRPHCTLIVAESQFRNPFDTSHTVMLSYEHLGKDVGAQEARRFRRALKGQIEALRAAQRIDSPVYTYLPQLQPPAAVQASTPRSAPVLEAGGAVAMLTTGATAAVPEPAGRDLSLKQLLETAQQLVDQRLYAPAASLLEELRRQRPHDSDITQRLALAIYKSEQPDAQTALHAARELLRELNPASTNDPQTLGLWGAIHKRLWEHRAHAPYLDASIEGYERGFYLKQDHYNGINLAFMLDVRGELAASSGDMANAITDHTLAARVRREVLRWCADQAERLREVDPMDRYWVLASLWEASLGLGDEPGRLKWEAQLATITVPEAMRTTRERQATQLRDLLASARMRGMPIGAAPNRAADDAVIAPVAPPAIPRERQDSALPASPGG